MARRRIGEILVQAGVLSEDGLRTALAEQQRWGGHLGRILVDMRLVSEEVLVKALSAQLNFPIIDLDRVEIPEDVLRLVSPDTAEESSVIPVRLDGKFLDVAMADPINVGIIDELRIRTQLNVRPYLAGPHMIQRALAKFYNRGVNYTTSIASAAPSLAEAVEPEPEHAAEIRALQKRISALEALVSRDEDVLRKLLGLLVEKGLATREEILERIR